MGQVPASVEIKSKCTPATAQKETCLAQQYGYLKSVVVHGTDPNGSIEFQECIPEHDYCAQVIHGMACGDLQDALYIVASLRTIIRVVHVHLHEEQRIPTDLHFKKLMSAI